MGGVAQFPTVSDRRQVTYLKRFSTYSGVRPNNLLTEEKARKCYDKGESIAIVIGDPESPE